MSGLAAWEPILEQLPDDTRSLFMPFQNSSALASEFIQQGIQKNPAFLSELLHASSLQNALIASEFENLLLSVQNETELMRVSRQFRLQQMLRIAWGDLSNQLNLLAVMQEVSQLADVMLSLILKKLMAWHVEQYGLPQDAHQHPQSMIIIALGKLGGKELRCV